MYDFTSMMLANQPPSAFALPQGQALDLQRLGMSPLGQDSSTLKMLWNDPMLQGLNPVQEQRVAHASAQLGSPPAGGPTPPQPANPGLSSQQLADLMKNNKATPVPQPSTPGVVAPRVTPFNSNMMMQPQGTQAVGGRPTLAQLIYGR